MSRAGGGHAAGAFEPAVGTRVLDMDVLADRGEIGGARHAIADHLTALGVPIMVVDDLELIASELVTNAIVHPHPGDRPNVIHVHVDVTDEIAMSVTNVGSAAAIPPIEAWQPASPVAMSGRGLGIVRRLCDDVAVEQRGDLAVVSCWRHLPDGGAMP
jgi:anti-sigma regulatory factor (Ser/Thr protein kinase)